MHSGVYEDPYCRFTTPKKRKYVVVSHQDETAVLGFLISSSRPGLILKSKALMDCTLTLLGKHYPFLTKPDSYVDCSEAFEYAPGYLAKLMGKIHDRDVAQLQTTILRCRAIKRAHKELILGITLP